jgi:hypothetical protein
MTKIEITYKFVDQVEIIEVEAQFAWKALNHYRHAWNVAEARFV